MLYAELPWIATTIRERRLRFSDHCLRSKNEVVSDLVLMGTEAWQKGRRRTGSHICRSAGGEHRGPQRLLAGSDGWQGWLEKEYHGGSTEVDLVVVAVAVVVAVVVVVVAVVVVVVVVFPSLYPLFLGPSAVPDACLGVRRVQISLHIWIGMDGGGGGTG